MRRWIWMAAVAGLAACGGSNSGSTNQGSMPPETRISAALEVRPDTLTLTGGAAAVGGLPLASGFYRITDVEGELRGTVSVLCYTPRHGNQYVGEAIIYAGDPNACEPMRTRATADGWVNTVACTDQSGRLSYTFEGRVQPNGDIAVRDTAVDSAGGTPQGLEPRGVVTRRVGSCPAGWRPGDFMTIDHPGDNGRYDAHQIGEPPDANAPSYDRLPPVLAALLD